MRARVEKTTGKRKVSEDTARHWITGMRSIARQLPISPFHLAAADDMERMLEELLELRKQLKELKNEV
jgi:hypothetical protein